MVEPEIKHYHGNDGSDDSSDEEMTDASIKSLKEELAINPSNYDKHLELIKVCKESGELDELRTARETFAKIFPLTEKLWMEWIADETSLTESEEEHEKLVELYETALGDYLCPDLWLNYCQYALRWLGAEGGLGRFRGLCERAITQVGLHPEKGAPIWEIYRETETALDGEDKKERVTKILRRQVALPLYDSEIAFKELKQIDSELWKKVKSDYDAAKIKLKELDEFEAKLRLTDNPSELAEIWKQYLKYEIKKGDPVRIEFAYDRATTQLCLNPALWMEFLAWAKKIKSPNLKKISLRAARNCSWDENLWIERLNFTDEDPMKTFDEAIEALEGVGIERLQGLLWQLVLIYRRRATQSENMEETNISDDAKNSFRAAVKKAIQISSSLNATELVQEFETFGAEIEIVFFEEIARGRSKFEKLFKSSFGQDGKNWVRFAELEQFHGDLQFVRKIYKKGITFSKINCDDLFAKALHFERIYGSQEELESAASSIARKQEENFRKEQKEAAEKEKAEKRAEKQSKKVGKKNFKAMAFVKPIDESADEPFQEPERKKPKRNPKTNGDSGSSLSPQKMETDTLESMKPPAGDFKAPMPMAPPMGLPTAFGSKKPVQPKKRPPPIQKDNKSSQDKNEQKEEVDPNQPKFKHAETAEEKERTVYVSNMDYKLKHPEKELKKIFVGCGEIEEYRMVKNGVLFRGYGYVMFKEKKGHDNALLRDRTRINGRPCFVSKFSEPGDNKNKKDFKFNDGKEDHRVFVKHPKPLSIEEIRQVFEKCGTIIDTRLPETREGRRKPFFYVEFATALEATKANLMLHQKEVFGHVIEVLVSDPPKRGKQASDEPKIIDISKTAYATPRSKFNLVPRNIKSSQGATKKAAPSKSPKVSEEKSDSGEKSTPKPKAGLSNADFAKLFSS